RDEKDAQLRKLVVAAISAQDDEPTLNALAVIDGRSADDVRDQAIDLAGARTSTRAAEGLVRFLIDAQHPGTAERAVFRLGRRSEGQVVPPLLAELERSGAETPARVRVISALSDRTDGAIAQKGLALLGLGRGDRGLVELVRRRAEARAGLLALTAHPEAQV